MIRNIECLCGEWEQMEADEQRWHSQTFEWQENLEDNNALYKCPCGEIVQSTLEDT